MAKDKQNNAYQSILNKIFNDHYKQGITEFTFKREEIETAANDLNINIPKNLGDVVYSVRYRLELPDSVTQTAPEGMEWVIEGSGRAQYNFKLLKKQRIEPSPNRMAIKVPDATPEIIKAHSLNDEQATLTKIRYNRLLDIFLGITVYSLQNHLRTTVQEIGQIEIDEIYVGVDRNGKQYIIPVQAKGGTDRIGAVQTKQDIAYCSIEYPGLICRAISAYLMDENKIALFELMIDKNEVKVAEERHYILVPHSSISKEDLDNYNKVG